MKKILYILVVVILFGALLSMCGCSSSNSHNDVPAEDRTNSEYNDADQSNNTSGNTKDKSVASSAPATPIEYDKLQKLFLYIDETTTKDDIVNKVESEGLFYTEEHYNSGETVLCIAYTEGAALQRYADSGDQLEVAFDDRNDGALEYMTYNNSPSPTALYYRYGTWYEFDFDKDNLAYSGCYVVDPLSDDGITIKYENGNESSTGYFLFDSKEAVINELLDGTKE